MKPYGYGYEFGDGPTRSILQQNNEQLPAHKRKKFEEESGDFEFNFGGKEE